MSDETDLQALRDMSANSDREPDFIAGIVALVSIHKAQMNEMQARLDDLQARLKEIQP